MINMTNVRDILREGQIFKDYKELCKALGEEAKDGTSRPAQVNNFKRYFEFDYLVKGKRAIIIKEIYDSPRPILDGRSKGKNSKYTSNIEKILLNYIIDNGKNNSYTFLRKDLWLILGIVNYNYINESYDDFLLDKGIANRKQINDWKNLFYQVSDKVMFRVFDSMQNRELISYYKELVYNKEGEERIACIEEETIYNNIQNQVLKEIGLKYNKDIKTLYQIYPYYSKEYYKRVNDIMEKEYDWLNIRIQYKFIVITSYIEKLSNKIILRQRKDLNEEFIEAVNNKIESNYRRLVEKNAEQVEYIKKHTIIGVARENTSKLDFLVNHSDYLNVMKNLTNEYVRI